MQNRPSEPEASEPAVTSAPLACESERSERFGRCERSEPYRRVAAELTRRARRSEPGVDKN